MPCSFLLHLRRPRRNSARVERDVRGSRQQSLLDVSIVRNLVCAAPPHLVSDALVLAVRVRATWVSQQPGWQAQSGAERSGAERML